MENWLILNKLVILIYIADKIVNGSLNPPGNMLGVVLFLLFFIVLNMGKAIVQNSRYKLMFLCISVLELLFCYFFINPIFIVLIPINVFELFSHNPHWRYTLVALFLSAFFINSSSLSEYIIISLLDLIGFVFVFKGQVRIQMLLKDNEKLQEKNNKLIVDLNNKIIYKHQIIYTSQLEERNKIA